MPLIVMDSEIFTSSDLKALLLARCKEESANTVNCNCL